MGTVIPFTDVSRYVRAESRNLPIRELLKAKATVLLGVDQAAANALAKIEIVTVFDLATSGAFAAARQLVASASDFRSALAQYGAAPPDLVREGKVAGKALADVQLLAIDALDRVPEADAAAIATALDTPTVRDFANYPPYTAALAILDAAYFPERAVDYDPDRPPDLLPKTGEYPTERVQYSTLLLDEIPLDGVTEDVTAAAFKPLDLARLAAADAGFQKVAFGALLTFNQSWYAQGVTLGQLLHSTSLAPGESTRIAMVDWSRRSRAGETEVIDERDDLTNDTSHNRSISEVTRAVATEAQGGFSSANTNSHSEQSGTSTGGEFSGGLLGSLFGGPSVSFGTSSGSADSRSHADSYSSSWGRRDLSSSVAQHINDRTHQHAHSSRSRRASVVKEVSQSEHEGVSTRVIANYNHMHALTVQYYEVVQLYRVEVALASADRVIFLPVQLVDFTNDDLIRRFQNVLVANALTYEMRDALRNLDVIEVAPDIQTNFTYTAGPIVKFFDKAVFTRTAAFATVRPRAADLIANRMPMVNATMAVDTAAIAGAISSGAEPALSINMPVAARPRLSEAISVVQQVNDGLWSMQQTAQLSGLLNRVILRPNSTSVFVPADVKVEGGAVAAGGAQIAIVFHTAGGTVTAVSPDAPLGLAEVQGIALKGSSSDADVNATITLTLNRNGVRFPLQLPTVTVTKGTANETTVVQIKPGGVSANLKNHLSANRMHYSQAVFRSLDATQIALLLSGKIVPINGKPIAVAQLVEPLPIRYVGNYLAFRMNVGVDADPNWKQWLDDHGVVLGSAHEQIVPLGTGGTFAEAVLGRSNSAEKLDITRFWNWQDSPIPLQPSEIAAIQTGSRATTEDTSPGTLSNPIINITAPATLPDPAGTAAILAAIQNGNMFRDMSGLQATVGLAQAALQATAAGAATAGQQAGTNMQNHLQAQTERMRIAADLVKSAMAAATTAATGVPVSAGGSSSGGGSHSQDGAKINYFDKTAGQTSANGTSSANGSGPVALGAGGQSGGGESAAAFTGNGHGASPDGGGFSRNPGILAATWGDERPPSSVLGNLLDRFNAVEGQATNGTALGSTTKAWPNLDRDTVLTRINTLKNDANAFNQGTIGLCTAAAFYHHAIQRDAAAFGSFANALYGAGLGFLGNLKVSAGSDLRSTDYAALLARYPAMPPQADWMLMSALRDSENWIFDFEGAPDETFAMSTSAKELSGWYERTGFYTNVAYSEDRSLAAIKAINKQANNQIALWIRAKLIGVNSDATHMITLESPLAIDEANNKVTGSYWTWGQPPKQLAVTLDDFKASYLGAITATT